MITASKARELTNQALAKQETEIKTNTTLWLNNTVYPAIEEAACKGLSKICLVINKQDIHYGYLAQLLKDVGYEIRGNNLNCECIIIW